MIHGLISLKNRYATVIILLRRNPGGIVKWEARSQISARSRSQSYHGIRRIRRSRTLRKNSPLLLIRGREPMEEKTKKYPSLHRKLFYVEPINTDFIKARPGEHFHMKMSFPNASYANKTYLHMKGCTPRYRFGNEAYSNWKKWPISFPETAIPFHVKIMTHAQSRDCVSPINDLIYRYLNGVRTHSWTCEFQI